MSIAFALGIVAVVNLALGYALAVVLEADRRATHAPSPSLPTTYLTANGVVASTTLPADNTSTATATQENQSISDQRAATSADGDAAAAIASDSQAKQWSTELANLAAQLDSPSPATAAPPKVEDVSPAAGLTAEPNLPIHELSPDRAEPTTETIAHCEHLLDETEKLVRKHLLEQAAPADSNSAPSQPSPHVEPVAAAVTTDLSNRSVEDGVVPTDAETTDLLDAYQPREPRATLLDASQLDEVLNDWWQNDPSLSQPLCVAQIEIDNLRQLTADCGTLVAGNISKHLENLLLATLRRDDSLAALGRSRFLAILPGVKIQAASKLIEESRAQVEALEFIQSGRPLSATITAAVAQTTADESQEQLLARAAKALADARSAGRNRVAWHDGKQSRLMQPSDAEPRRQLVLN